MQSGYHVQAMKRFRRQLQKSNFENTEIEIRQRNLCTCKLDKPSKGRAPRRRCFFYYRFFVVAWFWHTHQKFLFIPVTVLVHFVTATATATVATTATTATLAVPSEKFNNLQTYSNKLNMYVDVDWQRHMAQKEREGEGDQPKWKPVEKLNEASVKNIK